MHADLLFDYCNWTRTQNYLVRKRTLNHLAKWLSVRLRAKWFWIRVQLQSLNLQILRLLRGRSSLTFRQPWSVDSLWNAYVTQQEQTVSFWSLFLLFECEKCLNTEFFLFRIFPHLDWIRTRKNSVFGKIFTQRHFLSVN